MASFWEKFLAIAAVIAALLVAITLSNWASEGLRWLKTSAKRYVKGLES